MMNANEQDDSLTLDPPGSIAIVGAGPLGIEAALYGRFLGYEVTIIEAVAVANSHRNRDNDPLPMLPDRSLSPLAISALGSQYPDLVRTLPVTYGEWITAAWEPLIQSDLLSGRVRCPSKVVRIEKVDVQPDDPDEDTSDIPPDFRLTLASPDGNIETIDFEAVIVAIGSGDEIDFGFDTPADYLFRIGTPLAGESLDEHSYLTGLKEIVATFAILAGRSDLDLYRPRRGGK